MNVLLSNFARRSFILLFSIIGALHLQAQTYLINEDFSTGSGGTAPTGWSTEQLYTTYPGTDVWRFDNPGGRPTYSPLSGTFAVFDSDNYSNNGVFENIALQSPSFSTIGVPTVNLTLDIQFGGGVATGYVEVFDGVNWNIARTITGSTGNASLSLSLDISSYARNTCNARIRFRWSSNSGSYWAIDNVKVYYSGTPNTTDARVLKLENPVFGACGSSTMQFRVTVKNEGTSSIGNFNVKAIVNDGTNTTTVNQTAPATIASCSTALITFSSTVNMSSATANYSVTVITELSGDQRKTSDTLAFTNFKVQAAPAQPTPQNLLICGTNSVKIGFPLNVDDNCFWYKDNSTQTAFFSGDSIETGRFGFMSDTTIYVETYRATKDVFPSSWSAPPTAAYAAGSATGYWLNITASNNIILDSFGLLFRDPAGTNGTVDVYYRSGTYQGYESNSSAWTKAGSATIVSNGLGIAILRVGNIRINAGQQVALYFASSMSLEFRQSSYAASNNDFSVDANNIHLGTAFSLSQYLSSFSYPGTVYYKKPCVSNRVSVKMNFEPKPQPTVLTGSKFQGTFSNDPAIPDAVKAGDTLIYELTAPLGYTNAQFGNKWYLGGLKFNSTSGGVSPDTLSGLPKTNANAFFRFIPSSSFTDTLYDLQITVSDVNGCDSVIKRRIYVAPEPNPAFTIDRSCKDVVVNFNNTSSILKGTMSFEWDFGDGYTSNDVNPTHVYTQTGTYQVSLVATSDFGIKNSVTIPVNVIDIPQVNFLARNACEGDSLTFTDNSNFSGGTPVFTWSFDDGSSPISGNLSAIKKLYAAPGVYNVTLKVDVNGCASERTKNVTQAPRAKPDFSFTTNDCHNSKVDFKNLSTGPAFGSYGSQWKLGNGTTLFIESPSYIYNQYNTYQVTLITSTDLNCKDSITKTVALKQAPEAKFTIANGSCSNDKTTFTNTTTEPVNSSTTYEWIFGDGNTSQNKNTVHDYIAPGVYMVKLRAISANGCTDEEVSSLTIREKPKADFTAPNVCVGEVTNFSNNSHSSTGGMAYTWDFDNGQTSVSESPSITYTNAGTYDVVLKADIGNGCVGTIVKTVSVFPMPVSTFVHGPKAGVKRGVVFDADDGTNGNTYQWIIDFGGTGNTKTLEYQFPFDGNFRVILIVTNKDGCSSRTEQIVNMNTAGISDVAEAMNVRIYPNPAKDNVYVETEGSEIDQISLYTITGQEVLKVNGTGYKQVLQTASLPAGVYVIKVQDKDGKIANSRIAIR